MENLYLGVCIYDIYSNDNLVFVIFSNYRIVEQPDQRKYVGLQFSLDFFIGRPNFEAYLFLDLFGRISPFNLGIGLKMEQLWNLQIHRR